MVVIWTVLASNQIVELIGTRHPSAVGTVWRVTSLALFICLWVVAIASTWWLIKHRRRPAR